MSGENSTANSTHGNDTKAAGLSTEYTTQAPVFFDPAWQLAVTVEYYIRYAVIVIGICGMAANALVLYALISYNARQAKKRAANLLIIHQNVLDLFSCVLLVITYSVGTRENLEGALGYFVCTVIMGESAMNCPLYASVINLMAITVERYLKVVHPFWSKKHLKRWMIYAAMAFTWIAGILLSLTTIFTTSVVIDGNCLTYYVWESTAAYVTFEVIISFVIFILPVSVFIYCYGHIVVVIRKQMRVMAGHIGEGTSQMTASQIQSKRIKWNITKTMIFVTVAFVICWFPTNVYFPFLLAANIVQANNQNGGLLVGYYPTVFLAYFNICMNPFIYAVKHEGVKQKLASMMAICNKCKGPTAVADDSGNETNIASASGTKKTHAIAMEVLQP